MRDDTRIPKSVGIYGPYTDRGGPEYFKVVVGYATATPGKREQTSSRCKSKTEAEGLAADMRALIAAGAIGEAALQGAPGSSLLLRELVARHCAGLQNDLRRSGMATPNKLENVETRRGHLVQWLPLDEKVEAITPKRAASIARKIAVAHNQRTGEPLADSTRYIYHKELVRLFAFAQREGYVRSNPFAALPMPVIRVQKRKAQLRIDQARRFIEVGLEAVNKPSGGRRVNTPALAALACLVMGGPRAGELVDAQVQDLDDNGRLLWVDKGKTDSARRYLEVPEYLQAPLALLTAGRAPQEPLFPAARRQGPMRKLAIRKALRLLLKRAGLPHVCPHGLRGTFMSITAPRVGLTAAFAAQVGHGDSGQTATRSYLSTEAKLLIEQQRRSDAQATAQAILSPKARPAEAVDLPGLLATLPLEQVLRALPSQLRARLDRQEVEAPTVSDAFPAAGKVTVSD